MNHVRKIAQILALSAFSMFSTSLLAEDCSYPGPLGVCPAGTFEMSYMDGLGALGEACESQGPCVDLESKLGPSPAFIVCSPVGVYGGRFECVAWPQGDLSYDWVLDSGVEALDEPFSGGASRDVRCASGGGRMVSVTITAPNQTSDTAFTQISCGL